MRHLISAAQVVVVAYRQAKSNGVIPQDVLGSGFRLKVYLRTPPPIGIVQIIANALARRKRPPAFWIPAKAGMTG